MTQPTKPTMSVLLKQTSFTIDDSVIVDADMYELFIIALQEKAAFALTEKPIVEDDGNETSVTFKGTVSIIKDGASMQLVQVEMAFKYPKAESDIQIKKDFFKWAIITLPGEWNFLHYFPEHSRWVAGTVLDGCTLTKTKIAVGADKGKDSDEFEFERGLTFNTDMIFAEPVTIFEVKELGVKGHIEPRDEKSGGLDFSVDNGLIYSATFSFPRGSTLNVYELEGEIGKRTVKGEYNGNEEASQAYQLFSLKTKTKLKAPVEFIKSTFEMNEAEISLGNIIMQDGNTLDSAKMLFWMRIGGKITLNNVAVHAEAQFPLTKDPLIDFSLKADDEDGSADLLAMVGASAFSKDILLEPQVPSLGLVFSPNDKQIISVRINISTGHPWTLVDDFLIVEGIDSTWTIDYPFQSDRQFTGQIDGKLKIGESHLMLNATVPDGDVSAQLEDSAITITELLNALDPKLGTPPSMGDFALTALNLNASPKGKSFHFDGTFSDLWHVDAGLGNFEIKSLFLSLDLIRNDYIVQFGGVFTFVEADFIVLVKHSKDWDFSAGLAPGSSIDISNLINNIFSPNMLSDDFGLKKIKITELWLDFGAGASNKYYHFRGKAEWELLLGLSNLKLAADLDISKGKQDSSGNKNELSGEISASLSTADAGFKHLQLTVIYKFGGEKILAAELIFNGAKLTGTCTESTLTFKLDSTLTVGDILTYIAGLVDPDIGPFTLDEPWDVLGSFQLAFTLTIDLNTKKTTVTYDPGIKLGFATVTNLSVSYDPKANKNGFKVSFNISYTGIDGSDSLSWDPMNEQAPASKAPGKEPPIELYYLGLGHHLTLENPGTTVGEIVDDLEDAVRKDISYESLVYDRESDWLIGARFSIKDLLEMSIIFNDPVLYGMVIFLKGNKVPKNFSGLRFEILYLRINDSLGVYHSELTLPDAMRHFNIGAVAVTLPVVAVDIYTNGDFAVDVGFPWNGDWSRAARAEAGIFIGVGGFYFAKLSGVTAAGFLPPVKNSGKFGLVLKFGLALRLGVGKSYDNGPLKAEFSLTMQGVLEGVLAWYHYPPALANNDPVLYHRLQASVQLVGRLYGSVDFAVIKIEVEVIVYAGMQMTLESFKATHIVLVAEVSVRASIKILFITIRFSFDLTLRTEITIGSDDDSQAVWLKSDSDLNPTSSSTPARLMAFGPPVASLLTSSGAFKVWDEPKKLNIIFQPAFTKGLGSNPNVAEVKGVALLFIDNTEAKNGELTDFGQLTLALLSWVLQTKPGQEVGLDLLKQQHDHFTDFSFNELTRFLSKNLTFNLTSRPADATEQKATVFPMFPQLSLKGSDGKAMVNFDDPARKKSTSDIVNLLQYYEKLKSGRNDNSKKTSNANNSGSLSIAAFVFTDYFAMLTKSALNSAIEVMQEEVKNMQADINTTQNNINTLQKQEKTFQLSLTQLLHKMTQKEKIDHLSGIVSRFMLHGLRLPFALPITDESPTYPLYELTGQQFTGFPLDDELDTYSLSLKPTTTKPQWITFAGNYLTVSLREQKIFIQGIKSTSFTPKLIEDSPKALPLSCSIPRHFSFSHRQDFSDQGNKSFIWPLPAGLTDHLLNLKKDGNPAPELALKVSQGTPTKTGKKAFDISKLDSYKWGTLVDFTIRRLAASDGSGFLKNTYLITHLGGHDTNSSSEDYLEEILAAPTTAAGSLLYEDKDKKLVSPPNASFNLLRTNRSGGSGDSTLVGADQNSALDLAGILWQAGKIEGGTYLHFASESGDGLPAEIFDSNGTTVVRLLVIENSKSKEAGKEETGKEGLPTVCIRHNCLITDLDIDPKETALFAETTTENEKVKVLIVKPGHVGFRITRQPLALKPSDNEWSDELDNLFQLLSYRLSPTTSFNGTPWGMPVGPSVDMGDPDNPNDDVWAYERVIPVYRFAQKPADVSNGLPLASENPYAGIAKDASISLEFEFLDVYGNRTNSASLPSLDALEVKYTDNILGLKSWPGLVLIYAVGSGPQLILSLQLNLESFIDKDLRDDEKQAKQDKIKNARETYRQIYYQVHQKDLTFTVTSSLDHSPTDETLLMHTPDKKQFTDFVDNAFAFFDAWYKNPDNPPNEPKGIEISVPLNGNLPNDLIFPVTVQIEMKRDTDLIHTDFQDVEAVKRVVTEILPPPGSNNASDPAALKNFAGLFEDVFTNLKLMSGNVDDNFGQPASLWAVRWAKDANDPGIYYQIDTADKAVFFAPPPLSNRLLSGDVLLNTFVSGTGLNSTDKSQRFNGVDLDAWGRDFLAAVDAFLEADLSVPAYVDTPDSVDNPVHSILKSKSVLANAIASQVQPILQRNDVIPDKDTAENLFKQQVLDRLENAYTIETIAQLGVDITMNGSLIKGINPRLSGKPLPSNLNGDRDYTLSAAKIPLTPGRSTLTFLYNTPAPEKEGVVEINMSYHVNALEFKISNLEGELLGYQDSSWLTFILAPDGTSIDKLEIPVPLRVFPTPPSLIMQRAAFDEDSQKTLKYIREWQYSFIYEHQDAAQDAIETKIYYNQELSNGTHANAVTTDSKQGLLVALANFRTVYPQLYPYLEKLRAKPDDDTLKAVQVFAKLVDDVATAWQSVANAPGGTTGSISSANNPEYYELDTADLDTPTPSVTVNWNSINDPTLLQVDLPGYKLISTDNRTNSVKYSYQPKADDEPLDPSYGVPNIPDFKISIADRDIIEYQNAQAEIWVSRNRNLGSYPTNPAFIYQTPGVRFGNMVTPLLVNTKEWHLEEEYSQHDPKQSLDEHIKRLFEILLPGTSSQAYDLRISCSYAFALAEGEGGNPDLLVPLPVTLCPRVQINMNTTMLDETVTFRTGLSGALRNWFEKNQPSRKRAMFIFKVVILSPGNNLPLLQIEDLRLSLENITDLQPALAPSI